MKLVTHTLFAAACVAAASAAQALPRFSDLAHPPSDKLSVELFAGANAATPGSFRGLTTQPDAQAGTLKLDDMSFDDAYSRGVSGGLELGYAVTSNLSAYARAAYNRFDGDATRIGFFEPATGGLRNIDARFGDSSSREFDLGTRYTFLAGRKVRPFVGAALGATHLDGTKAVVDNPDGVGATSMEFAKRATVFSQRLETGVQFSPARNFDVRLTAAADHVDGGGRSGDPNLELLGLDPTRTEMRAHWDYPAELGAVWHF